jgi:aspartate-semialdehyde dehydrogenase
MPIDTSNQDLVFAGRVRPDHVLDGGLSLWCCGDQIRKGAAANAVEILEYLEKR